MFDSVDFFLSIFLKWNFGVSIAISKKEKSDLIF